MYLYTYVCIGASWDKSRVRAQCFTSLPLRRLRWSAGAASSSFIERHFSYSPEYWSQSGAPRPKASSRRQICGPSFSPDSLRLRRPAVYGPERLRAGPSGEERRTPHYSLPVSPQCPQEIGLPTLPVLQGAESSERFSQLFTPIKRSGAERLAAPSGVPRAAGSVISCRSSASGHTRGQFRETGSLSRGFMRFALGQSIPISFFPSKRSLQALKASSRCWEFLRPPLARALLGQSVSGRP